MKNMNKIMTIALLGSSIAFSACNDWLALEPENSVTVGKYWNSEEDVAGACTGIYCSMLNGTALQLFMWGEMRADYMTIGPKQLGTYYNIRRGDITSSNGLVSWASIYTVINNCNILLESADKALANDASFSVTACEQYKAQARVIRSMMYFYLVRMYKDVPYITWAYDTDDIERSVAVTPQSEIIDALIADLEAVKKSGYLPFSYSSTSVAQNKGKVTMYALDALLADIYLWKGSLESQNESVASAAYQKCVELCNEIIESGQFSLVPVPRTNPTEEQLLDAQTKADSSFYVMDYSAATNFFESVYVKGNSSESIFELQSDDYTSCGSFYTYFVHPSSRYCVPNKEHVRDDIFLSTTNEIASNFNYSDVRYRMGVHGAGDPSFCWKLAGADFTGTNYSTANEFVRNFIIYRLAQVYLMKAEALNQLAWANGEDQTSLAQAYDCLYKVRNRACAVETTDVTLDNGNYAQVQFWNELKAGELLPLGQGSYTLSCQIMEQFILDEEGREMMFEGKRWFDIIRNAARNDYGNGSCKGGKLNYLTDIVVYSTDVDKVTYLRQAFKNKESHYLPYPYTDVKYNDLLSQKPFYGVE